MGREIKRVGVIGAGAMGRGIAQVCALAGCVVQLFDAVDGVAARALESIRGDLGQAVAKARMRAQEADAALARIAVTPELSTLHGCDLVVEAIVEDMGAKQTLFRELEPIVGPECILASNTSSLSITSIAAACSVPDRVAGWHFFNPVPRMKVVEVVQAPRTAEQVIASLVELATRLGHRAIRATDSPGFVVNHAGRAFVTEGLKLLAENTATHNVLDDILRNCAGFRMGPFELLDLTGLDVSVPVMESIHAQYYGDDRYRPAALARSRMAAGLLGRKSMQGFYRYESGEALKVRPRLAKPSGPTDVCAWWPSSGRGALPQRVLDLLRDVRKSADPTRADVVLVAPLGEDLSSAIHDMWLDPSKAVGVDPLFSGPHGVTLMRSPASTIRAVDAASCIFAAQNIPAYVVCDSPGFVAPRVIACIVNLACEMAQQGIALPADLDAAARLGLGYPVGPFEWGDRIGAKHILDVLKGLHATFGDQRYRPAPWLVRRARLGLPLSTPDADLITTH